jgi:hypothetical protein
LWLRRIGFDRGGERGPGKGRLTRIRRMTHQLLFWI